MHLDPNRKSPVMEFEDDEQLMECVEEWQKILFLEDWIIQASLHDMPLLDKNDQELQGRNEFCVDLKNSFISVIRPNDDARSRIVKFCAECTLVHELLHCKYNWLAPPSPRTLEGAYFDTLEHGLLEQMAKSLIMARYHLPFEWFKNF